jgi:adenosine/AMP kinase
MTNPVEVIVAETNQGRGVLGVIDGFSPKGIEGEDDVAWRKNLLRQFGYKLRAGNHELNCCRRRSV